MNLARTLLARWLERRAEKDRGAVMVEFAIVAPMLILLVMGVGDLAPTIMVKTRVANATHSAADLTTQFSQMQTSDVVGVYTGAADVMAPFSSSPLVLRISNVVSDGNGRAFVSWSCGQGALPPYAANATITTTPTNSPIDNVLYRTAVVANGVTYQPTNTSVVFAESIYIFRPPAGVVIQTAQTMTVDVTSLPRLSSYVGFPWDGDSDDTVGPPASTSHSATTTLSNGVVCNYRY